MASTSRSLNRQDILDEDEYTAAISKIIARDFFPSLPHLDATNEYLEAVNTEDTVRLTQSVRRLQQLATPLNPEPSETPLRTSSNRGKPPTKKARYDTSLSLDEFQARYTSEDNASFVQILDDENRARRETYGWAWMAQQRAAEVVGKQLENREKLLIEGPPAAGVREKFLVEAPKSAGLLTEGERDGDTTSERPPRDDDKQVAITTANTTELANEEPVDVMAPRKDTRSATVDGWSFKARNALMFAPDVDVAPYQRKAGSTIEPGRGDPKAIKHLNTRLDDENEDSHSASISEPPSPTRSRIDAAIAGERFKPRSPKVNNFSYVQPLPSPTAAEMGEKAMKQLMTWGTITATPRVLSSSGDEIPEPSTPFRVKPPSARENVANRLSASASKSLRAKAAMMSAKPTWTPTPRGSVSGKGKSQSSAMPPPNWTPRRAEAAQGLTQAGRRLLGRSTGIESTAGSKRAEAMEQSSGWKARHREKDLADVRWTPTPGR